jgi:hypothetical protein
VYRSIVIDESPTGRQYGKDESERKRAEPRHNSLSARGARNSRSQKDCLSLGNRPVLGVVHNKDDVLAMIIMGKPPSELTETGIEALLVLPSIRLLRSKY